MADEPISSIGGLQRAVRSLVAFARGSRSTSLESTEIRQLLNTKTAQMLGAMARSKGMERSAYIEMVLTEHTQNGLREASLYLLSMSSNPTLQDAIGGVLESCGVQLDASSLPVATEELPR